MHIICLTPLAPGVYNDHKADHITAPPDGWAMIPEDFSLPSTFPRLGSIEAEELTYTREVEVQKEVTKTREVPQYDEEGNMLAVMMVEEYTEMETVTEEREYTMMTVTSMTEGTLPDAPTLSPADQRETAYNTEKIIPWEGDYITVTEAAQKWQYYAAEGSIKAYDLQSLIVKAKEEIREKYPNA